MPRPEMSAWAPPARPRIDPETASFFRGLVCGVALGLPVWVLLVLWVW